MHISFCCRSRTISKEKSNMDRTSQVEQQNCSGEEVPHSEPGLSKAKDILPEAQENGVAQRVPEDRSACECDEQQTEEVRSQLDTQGAVGVVGFKTRKCALNRETGNNSETESSPSPVEHHQMEVCLLYTSPSPRD